MTINSEAPAEHDSVVFATGNRLLDAMPRETRTLLERDLKQVSLPHGFVCFEAGDRVDRIYFPLTGMISLFVPIGDGETVQAAMIGPEGAAGLSGALGGRRSSTRAAVQIPGRFSTISAIRFEQAAADTALKDLLLRYTEAALAEAQQMAVCNAVHDASSRLCRWLLQIADRVGTNLLPLTQEHLADMLGVRRTTVTLLAQDLQRRGMVKYSRGHITLLDRAALEASACECYHTTKREILL